MSLPGRGRATAAAGGAQRALVGVLGDLQVTTGGVVRPINGERVARLLAAVVLAGRGGIGVLDLAGRVWDDGAAPSSAEATLRTYVRRLRRAIGDDAAAVVTTVPGGYALGGDVQVDAALFEAELARAQREVDHERAGELVTQALDRWRGPPWSGLEELPWARHDAERLEALYLEAVEERLRVQLATGNHGDVIAKTAPLVAAHPWRERLIGLRAAGLAVAGRQQEALACLRDHRDRMVDDLGVDPWPALERLQVAILAHDPELTVPLTGRPLRGHLVVARLRRDGPATVHRGRLAGDGAPVDIWVFDRDISDDDRFVRAFPGRAKTLARLRHHSIVSVLDWFREPGRGVIVAEATDGTALDELPTGQRPPTDLAALGADVADGLAYAHRSGVAHGAITPERIVVEGGTARLTGFALATLPTRPDAQTVGEAQAADVSALAAALRAVLPPDDAGTAAHDELNGLLATWAAEPDGADGPVEATPAAAELAAALRTFAAASTTRTASDVPNPYRGLAPFDEPDADRFFGRAGALDELTRRLTDDPLVLLVGPSGSGKSSLLHAGLVARLRTDSDVLVGRLVPGDDPAGALSDALAALGRADDIDPATRLAAGDALPDLALRITDGRPLVLVVDQLEELFAACAPEVAESFMALLADVIVADVPELRVVAALRADFYDRPLASPQLGPHVGRATMTLPPMTAPDLHAAIGGPAASVGIDVDDAVVAQLVAEAADHPGSLPLLQFALTLMWDHAAAGPAPHRIRVDDHEAVGGLAGAVAAAAERVHDGLDDAARDGLRRLWGRLVHVADDVSGRRERRGALIALPGVDDDLIDVLTAARLLTVDHDPATRHPTVEPAHDAVLTAWPRLQDWIASDRRELAVADRVRRDARDWDRGGRDSSDLYRGRRLDDAVAIGAHDSVALSDLEDAFLASSVAARVARQREAEARAAAEQHAGRRQRSTRVALVVTVVLLLVAAATAGGALRRRAAVQAAADHAALVGRAIERADTDPEVALLLAAEAWSRQPDTNAQRALLTTLQAMPDRVVDVWREPATHLDVGSAGPQCATSPEPGVVALTSPETGDVVRIDIPSRAVSTLRIGRLRCRAVLSTAGASGLRAVGVDETGRTWVFGPGDRRVGPIVGIAAPLLTPDGELVARVDGDGPGPFHRIDLDSRRAAPGALFTGLEARLVAAGRLAVVIAERVTDRQDPGGPRQRTMVLDTSTWEPVLDLRTQPLPTTPVTVSDDGTRIAWVDLNGALRVWDIDSGEPVVDAAEAFTPGLAELAALSADGTRIAVALEDGTVAVRDVDSRSGWQQRVSDDQLVALQWLDGMRVAAVEASGVVRVLHPDGAGFHRVGPSCCPADGTSRIVALADGEVAAVNHREDSVELIDVAYGARRVIDLPAGPGQIVERAVTGDGGVLVVHADGELVGLDADGVTRARAVPLGAADTAARRLDLAVDRTKPIDTGALVATTLGGAAPQLSTVGLDLRTLEVVDGPHDIDLGRFGDSITRIEPTGTLVAAHQSTTRGEAIHLLEPDGTPVGTVTTPTVAWLGVDPGRRFVLVAEDDGRIVRHDLGTGVATPLPIDTDPPGRDSMITAAVLNGDRAIIPVGQGRYELWDVLSPARIGTLATTDTTANHEVAAIDNEAWIVVDGTWHGIPLDPATWVTLACDLPGRSLTPAERSNLVPSEPSSPAACG